MPIADIFLMWLLVLAGGVLVLFVGFVALFLAIDWRKPERGDFWFALRLATVTSFIASIVTMVNN